MKEINDKESLVIYIEQMVFPKMYGSGGFRNRHSL